LKPSEIVTGLKGLTSIQQPVFIWGPPGVGKSDVVRQTAEQRGVGLKDFRAILMDPIDFHGIPFVSEDGTTDWAPPGAFPTSGEGILFLDELNAAPPLTQAALYQLILDRRLGDYQLPEGWSVIAAGNRASDRAVVHRMPSALANRFVHYSLDVNNEDWLHWANTNGINEKVKSFIRFRPSLLHDFQPEKEAFPTPRSWEFISNITGNIDPGVEFPTYAGTVGEGAATEFTAFIKNYENMPDMEELIKNPTTTRIPDEVSMLYAITGSLIDRTNEDTFTPIMKYIDRLNPEYQVIYVKESITLHDWIAVRPETTQWAIKNNDVIL